MLLRMQFNCMIICSHKNHVLFCHVRIITIDAPIFQIWQKENELDRKRWCVWKRHSAVEHYALEKPFHRIYNYNYFQFWFQFWFRLNNWIDKRPASHLSTTTTLLTHKNRSCQIDKTFYFQIISIAKFEPMPTNLFSLSVKVWNDVDS